MLSVSFALLEVIYSFKKGYSENNICWGIRHKCFVKNLRDTYFCVIRANNIDAAKVGNIDIINTKRWGFSLMLMMATLN